ncbi:hypothetical protein F1D05_33425 [Kribbella qitaiheensis]|uniref:Uncharacterized protein n=1 Tax=Kribbella qitaiheensis TaxID=1544730 RepID=A0A7G6X6Q8_9ACTN|nr:hypothetical protein [Kribbella qitaiheensis]QNE21923.1 hypothetical protein F1D05_33425 [Kribbella qitaiheensis]
MAKDKSATGKWRKDVDEFIAGAYAKANKPGAKFTKADVKALHARFHQSIDNVESATKHKR